MKRASYVLAFAAFAVFATLEASAQMGAAPATMPARGARGAGMGMGMGMGGPGAGPAVAPITENTPGMPGVAMPEPATGRKAKWPLRDANNTPPPGYTARSTGDNGF